MNKGVRLGAVVRSDEAVEVYDEVVRRFGDASEPELVEQVAEAKAGKANITGEMGPGVGQGNNAAHGAG